MILFYCKVTTDFSIPWVTIFWDHDHREWPKQWGSTVQWSDQGTQITREIVKQIFAGSDRSVSCFSFWVWTFFFEFQIKVRSINRLMDLLDIGMNYYNYSLCVRFNTAWNMWCLMSVSDLSSKCVATPFFAATFSAAFGSVWPRVINRQAHTKTTKTARTVPIRKIGLNRYQYQHNSNNP